MAWGYWRDGSDRQAWYVAPTLKQARRDLWLPLKRLARPYIATKNETGMSITLASGGMISLMGADNYDSLRGAGLNGLVLDECADIAPEAWSEALRPMLSDRLGRVLFSGTPKGRNWFWEKWSEARAGLANWAAWQFTTLQGGRVDAAEIDAARADLDLRTFQQEYEASFENAAGRVYYCFNRPDHVEPCRYTDRLELHWGLDFNIDPQSSVLYQIHRDAVGNSVVRVVDEIIMSNTRTQEVAAEAVRRIYRMRSEVGAYGQPTVVVHGDQTGANRQRTGDSDWQAIFEGLRRGNVDYRKEIHTSNPNVRDRINAVNKMLRTASGLIRLRVDPRCKALIKDFEQCEFKKDSNDNAQPEISQANGLSHVSDGLGYGIHYTFGDRAPTGPQSQFIG